MDWPATHVELIENGRVQVTDDEVALLLDLYKVADRGRREIRELAQDSLRETDDAFTWITSHTVRRTTATLLDEVGQSARQIGDQLGHARPSLTQDVYLGRAARNPGAAAALDRALRTAQEE